MLVNLMERKPTKSSLWSLPPTSQSNGVTNPEDSGSFGGSQKKEPVKRRVRIVGRERTVSQVPQPSHRIINLGEVVHPFKVGTSLVNSDEVYRDGTGSPTNTTSTALLPQDLYSSLIKRLSERDALMQRKKTTLTVPAPAALMKYAIYPRKSEKLPVYRIPKSEDLSGGLAKNAFKFVQRRDMLKKEDLGKGPNVCNRTVEMTKGDAAESAETGAVEIKDRVSKEAATARRKSFMVSGGLVRPHSTTTQENRYSAEELRAKFRYAIRMVKLMVGLNNILKDLQTKIGDAQSIEQLNYYSTEAEFAVDKLVFKKAHFAASNIMFVPTWARDLLSQRPEERNSKEVTRLAFMLKTLRYFKNDLQFEKLEDLCQHSSFALYEKQRTIMRTGHSPMFAYLLMSGSVFVNIEMKSQDDEKKKFVRTAAVLQRGSLFGEIAVIHNIRRTASIVSRENVECLVIDTETCMRIFPDAINRDFENRLHHLKESGLFTDWPHAALKDLCIVSKKVEHTYGDVIESNTASSEFIYMVTKGRMEVMYLAKYSSDEKEARSDNVVSISRLIAKPPNHMFLPPLPHPSTSLLQPSQPLTNPGIREVYMSMDSLYTYDCCDMLTLVKSKEPMPLILVSRGSEVIRIPKLRLQTIPPNHHWKVLLEKAKTYPMYPSADVLMQIYLEHRQWTSYRKLVFQDFMKYNSSYLCTPHSSAKAAQMRPGTVGSGHGSGLGTEAAATSSAIAEGVSEEKEGSGHRRSRRKHSPWNIHKSSSESSKRKESGVQFR